MRIYKPLAGESISETARNMMILAKKSDQIVTAKFNQITLIAKPSDHTKTIINHYFVESNRRRTKYVNSPEYKKQQRKAWKAQKRHDLALIKAFVIAPKKMTLRDEEGWKKTVSINSSGDSSGYGKAVINYAELWARLMEGQMANGITLPACAEKTSSLADNEGITGFMYGCAVSILSQVWIHGEELRCWHNLNTQIGNEGKKANKNGGILNPALLSIKKK